MTQTIKARGIEEAAPFTWASFTSLKDEPLTWLLEPLLPEQSLICLYGPRGLGKTFLALDFALSIATGREWLATDPDSKKARFPVKQNSVVYVLAESERGVKRRMRGWAAHYQMPEEQFLESLGDTEGDPTRSAFRLCSSLTPLDRFGSLELWEKQLEAMYAAKKFGLLVFDPLIAFSTGDENSAQDMNRVMASVRYLSKRFNCSVLLVHHSGKARSTRYGARGSSVLEAAMDTVLAFRPWRDGSRIIEVTKQREHKASARIVLHPAAVEAAPVEVAPVEVAPVEVAPVGAAPAEAADGTKEALGQFFRFGGVLEARQPRGSENTDSRRIAAEMALIFEVVSEIEAANGKGAKAKDLEGHAKIRAHPTMTSSRIYKRLQELVEKGSLLKHDLMHLNQKLYSVNTQQVEAAPAEHTP